MYRPLSSHEISRPYSLAIVSLAFVKGYQLKKTLPGRELPLFGSAETTDGETR
jgi:hypothetical protein